MHDRSFIVITEKVTDKYVSYNDTFYVRSSDEFGVIYRPIEECDMDEYWTACILDEEGDVIFDNTLNTYRKIELECR